LRVSLRQYLRLLFAYLRPQKRRASALFVLLLGVISLQLLNPLILRRFIDGALAGRPEGELTGLALAFLGVALCVQVLSVLSSYLAEFIGWTATNWLRADLALHCLRLDMSFHNDHTPGELIERVDGDVATLGAFLSRFIVQVLANAVLLLGVLVLLFGIHPIVGGALTTFAVLTLAVLLRLRNLAVPHWARARQASAELFGFLEERLAGTEDVRSSGATEYVMRSSYKLARNLLRSERRAGLYGSATGGSTVVLFAAATAISLGLGSYFYLKGALTIGEVYLIFTYAGILERPIEQITRHMQDLQQAGASIARITELLETRPTIVDGAGPDLPPGPLAVELDHATFAYSGAEPALDDLSFQLEPGQVLGIVGRTGSGKTTIARLLFRLYDPQRGAVRLGGVDLRETRQASIRARVGAVTQEIQLFHAPVRDNLTFFDRTVPDERILAVLRELGLWAWYESLSEGLDTLLPAAGGGLSAGEAQLLAFARVFLRDPGVVILDEASSRLDPSTEQRVEHAVDRLFAGRTGIVVAHRLATVERADVIMVLEHGRVIEYGARVALAGDPTSHFARLLRTGLDEALSSDEVRSQEART